jgi:hypothetical protein
MALGMVGNLLGANLSVKSGINGPTPKENPCAESDG